MNDAPLLFVTLSNIGDAVMTTPVLEAMHAMRPDAPIDIVAASRSSVVFEHCPYRRRILHKDKRQPMRGVWSLVRELRASTYEWVVDLRTDFLPYLLRARRRLMKWSGHAYGTHAVERHMGAIASLQGARAIPATTVWLGDDGRDSGRRLVAPLGAERLLALGTGANWAPKIWPAQHFIDLIAELKHDFNAVVLLGDAADRPQSHTVAARAALPCVDLCGRTTILQVAGVLSCAQAFVGNDSGLGHIASAVGIPSLTLFGPGDPERYHPWGPLAAWLEEPGAQLAALAPGRVAARLRAHLQSVAQRGLEVRTR